MCTITECVDKVIQETQSVTNEIEGNESIEDKINQYLDRVSYYRDSLNGVTKKFNELNEMLIQNTNFMDDAPPKEVFDLFERLLHISTHLLIIIRKSNLYNGLKTAYHNFHNEVDSFREIAHDIDIKYRKLPKDQVFLSLISEIKSLR